MSEKIELGKKGEESAVKYLQEHGYQILQRNFHCRLGEIDIVALDTGVLAFVEVKTRWSKEYGEPLEAITRWKLRKIIKTGYYYKMQHPELPEALRIDAVAISLDNDYHMEKIELVKNISQ